MIPPWIAVLGCFGGLIAGFCVGYMVAVKASRELDGPL